MTEMLDRSARAAFDALGPHERPWEEQPPDVKENLRNIVRAVLRELRQPTEAMSRAGSRATCQAVTEFTRGKYEGIGLSPHNLERIWKAIINAALGERT